MKINLMSAEDYEKVSHFSKTKFASCEENFFLPLQTEMKIF